MALSISQAKLNNLKLEFQLKLESRKKMGKKRPKLTEIWQKLLCKFAFILVPLRVNEVRRGKSAEKKKIKSRETLPRDVAGRSQLTMATFADLAKMCSTSERAKERQERARAAAAEWRATSSQCQEIGNN